MKIGVLLMVLVVTTTDIYSMMTEEDAIAKVEAARLSYDSFPYAINVGSVETIQIKEPTRCYRIFSCFSRCIVPCRSYDLYKYMADSTENVTAYNSYTDKSEH